MVEKYYYEKKGVVRKRALVNENRLMIVGLAGLLKIGIFNRNLPNYRNGIASRVTFSHASAVMPENGLIAKKGIFSFQNRLVWQIVYARGDWYTKW
jgi:hypothetical protein